MRLLCLFLLFCSTHAAGQEASSVADPQSVSPSFLQQYEARAVERWEKEIQKIEARDAAEPDPADAILFIGSSSIRRWDTIVTDMAPYRPVQRGYGGSRYSDVAVFAKRLLHPHKYRALVSFVGNDVSGGDNDHTPDQVERLVRYVVGVSHAHQPDAPVLLIEVTPTEKRFAAWPKIRDVNARLREVALSTPNTYFIPTAGHFLDPEGNPRSELFVEDRLHLNGDGYTLWSELIRRRVDEVLRSHQAFEAKPSEGVEASAN